MKQSTTPYTAVFLFVFVGFSAYSQIKVKKPEINISKPKIEIGGGNSGSENEISIGTKDPSGLFSNCTSDPSAEHHRKTAVANLATLEGEYTKTSINYDDLTKLIFENERTLGHIVKLEPKVNSEKYYAKYAPLKERADKENAIYAEIQTLEKLFEKEFNAPTKYKTPSPLTFRTDSYGAHDECYCRNYDSETKTFAEYTAAKKQYADLSAQLVGYTNPSTQTGFKEMDQCIENGNTYAQWVANENYQKEVVEYNTTNKAASPKKVIERCENYLEGIKRVETDYSLNYSEAAKTALSNAKTATSKIKTEAELYISSGEFQTYLDKVHAEKIAKVFLPKAATKNTTLEQGAMNYVKGTEYAEYLKDNLGESAVASTVRAVTLTTQPYVKKNEYGIPKYQYHELWVAYKGVDGKCYMTAVYASYTYKGGGVYASQPTWGADAPEEMSCLNLNK